MEILNSPYSFIFSGFGLIIGFAIPITNAIKNILKARDSSSWVQTKGIILKSKVCNYQDHDGQKFYKLDLEYSYDVNGQRFVSVGRFLDEEYGQSFEGKLREYADNNPPNKIIPIYYDPDIPENSVLINSLRARYFIPIAIYSIFIIVGLIFIVKGFKDIEF